MSRYLSTFFLTLLFMSAGAAEGYSSERKSFNLYGKFNGIHYLSKNIKQNGSHSGFIRGIQCETILTNQISSFASWAVETPVLYEGKFQNQKDVTLLSFAGLKFGHYGRIDYGHNRGVLDDVGIFTDVMPALGGKSFLTDYYLGRTTNTHVFTYRNIDFFGLVKGLNFALQFQGKESGENIYNTNTIKRYNGNEYGFSTSYEVKEGVTLSAAFTQNKQRIQPKFNTVHRDRIGYAKAYSLGVKYDYHDLYFAAIYSQNNGMIPLGGLCQEEDIFSFNNREKASNIECVLQYQMEGFRPSIGYLQSIIHNGLHRHHKLVKCIVIGTHYTLNKNISAFVDYRIGLMDRNKYSARIAESAYLPDKNNIFALGFTYTF
ncbi:porin [Candidatus Schneideria nysicola]|uniref:porin n=1 Tax=Candidatus Schneideria nysicola TaxID=1081631 RepID=UPI001CAA6506|nr:porin [Candidatus Schneideria nysicola]UAJ65480.1 porin [Candidatus Schneideria nysicola]